MAGWREAAQWSGLAAATSLAVGCRPLTCCGSATVGLINPHLLEQGRAIRNVFAGLIQLRIAPQNPKTPSNLKLIFMNQNKKAAKQSLCLPALNSNFLVYEIFSFFPSIKAISTMRSLSIKNFEKSNDLCCFLDEPVDLDKKDSRDF